MNVTIPWMTRSELYSPELIPAGGLLARFAVETVGPICAESLVFFDDRKGRWVDLHDGSIVEPR